MEKVALPDGAWAQLRDPDEITERQRRPLQRLQRRTIMKALPHLALEGVEIDKVSPAEFLNKLAPLLSDEDLDALEEIDDHVIVTLVESWSFDVPVSLDSTLDLPSKQRKALLAECNKLMGRVMGDTPDEDVLDVSSPTTPASDSDRP